MAEVRLDTESNGSPQIPEHLSPERKALLAQLLQKRLGSQEADAKLSAPKLPTITPVPEDRHRPFPLNDLQQAYWIGRSGEVDMGQVAGHSYIEIEGEFDLEGLNRAWRRLIDRHDMMRAIVLPEGTQQVLEQEQYFHMVV